MWTHEKVAETIKVIGFKPMNTKTELKSLHTILNDDEHIIAMVEGFFENVHQKKQSTGAGVAVLTDKRIVFYRKSILGTTTLEDYPLSKISSISSRKGILMASISIYASNNEASITNVNKSVADGFVNKAKEILLQSEKPQQVAATQEESNIDKIKKLFELKEMGALSEEEFNEQKRKLL